MPGNQNITVAINKASAAKARAVPGVLLEAAFFITAFCSSMSQTLGYTTHDRSCENVVYTACLPLLRNDHI